MLISPNEETAEKVYRETRKQMLAKGGLPEEHIVETFTILTAAKKEGQINMRIYNTEVAGLERALITAGYAKLATKPYERVKWEHSSHDITRGQKLGAAPVGSGHDHYLCGIRVWADWEAPCYCWPEIERYRYLDIVTSQSKMHRLVSFLSMDNPRLCFNDRTDDRAIALAQEYLDRYKQEPTPDKFEELLSNTPHGLELVAGISTNYLSLKTMYFQRRDHRLSWWRETFIEWCNDLPLFLNLIGQKAEKELSRKRRAGTIMGTKDEMIELFNDITLCYRSYRSPERQ